MKPETEPRPPRLCPYCKAVELKNAEYKCKGCAAQHELEDRNGHLPYERGIGL